MSERRKNKRGIVPFLRPKGSAPAPAVDSYSSYDPADYYVGDTSPAPESPSTTSYSTSSDSGSSSGFSSSDSSSGSTDGGSW